MGRISPTISYLGFYGLISMFVKMLKNLFGQLKEKEIRIFSPHSVVYIHKKKLKPGQKVS